MWAYFSGDTGRGKATCAHVRKRPWNGKATLDGQLPYFGPCVDLARVLACSRRVWRDCGALPPGRLLNPARPGPLAQPAATLSPGPAPAVQD